MSDENKSGSTQGTFLTRLRNLFDDVFTNRNSQKKSSDSLAMEDLKDLICEAQSETSEAFKKVLNQIRKSNLFQESQLLKTEGLENKFSILLDQFHALRNEWHNKGHFLSEEDMLFMLDNLDKLRDLFASVDGGNIFINSMYHRLLLISGWSTVATTTQIYDSLFMEVVGSTKSPEPKGSITEIFSQGFLRADKTLVRKAKVLVSTGYVETFSEISQEV